MKAGRLDEAARALQDAVDLAVRGAEAVRDAEAERPGGGASEPRRTRARRAAAFRSEESSARFNLAVVREREFAALGGGAAAMRTEAGQRALQAAADEYRAVIGLNPADVQAHFALSKILGRTGHWQEALAHLKACADIDARYTENLQRMLDFMVQRGMATRSES